MNRKFLGAQGSSRRPAGPFLNRNPSTATGPTDACFKWMVIRRFNITSLFAN
ncbi:hypothetical protein HanPSC8_Chr05g0206211 [Helianthus annuus]|nr:hypothetical protein HanPSC8_Chr05g0206211 [Helianthus annuus]